MILKVPNERGYDWHITCPQCIITATDTYFQRKNTDMTRNKKENEGRASETAGHRTTMRSAAKQQQKMTNKGRKQKLQQQAQMSVAGVTVTTKHEDRQIGDTSDHVESNTGLEGQVDSSDDNTIQVLSLIHI